MNPEVEKLIEDAEDLLNKAIREVDVNIRDAAEKAWGATVRATDALILDRRGFVPTGPTAMPDRRRALHEIYGMNLLSVKGKSSIDFTLENGCCTAPASTKASANPSMR